MNQKHRETKKRKNKKTENQKLKKELPDCAKTRWWNRLNRGVMKLTDFKNGDW